MLLFYELYVVLILAKQRINEVITIKSTHQSLANAYVTNWNIKLYLPQQR